jgi:hypothetical protein
MLLSESSATYVPRVPLRVESNCLVEESVSLRIPGLIENSARGISFVGAGKYYTDIHLKGR